MNQVWRFGVAVVGAAVLMVGLTAQQNRPRPEISLLGIRVFTSITEVVKRFGNPAMVTNAQVTITDLTAGQGERGSEGLPGPEGERRGPMGQPLAARARKLAKPAPKKKPCWYTATKAAPPMCSSSIRTGVRCKSARMDAAPTRACAPAAASG